MRNLIDIFRSRSANIIPLPDVRSDLDYIRAQFRQFFPRAMLIVVQSPDVCDETIIVNVTHPLLDISSASSPGAVEQLCYTFTAGSDDDEYIFKAPFQRYAAVVRFPLMPQ